MDDKNKFVVFTSPVVHDEVLKLLNGARGRLLDLGCGSGALINRLNDNFCITACDIKCPEFDLLNVDFRIVDLNNKLFFEARDVIQG